jgi:Domain of unknown function (DUF4336)
MAVMAFRVIFFILAIATRVGSFSPIIFEKTRNPSILLASPLKQGAIANFPLSIRAALIENAKKLDSELADGRPTGKYSPAGWSNRVGTALTPASIPGVYTADRPFYWNNIDVACRMTVIQLDDGNLWVHSPVGLDQQLQGALDMLGKVKYVVSPNYEHLKYAPQWYNAYPEAFMWGCPGLAERMPEIRWEGEIPAHITRPDGVSLGNCWDFDTITPLHLDMEVNPLTGKPFFNEVIFYHQPSKTLMTTDLYWNYPQDSGVPNDHLGGSEWELAPRVDSIPLGTKLWKRAMDKVYLPLFKNLMVNDRSRYDEIVKVILDEWDVETVIPAHGDIIRGKELCSTVLQNHLR